MEPDNIIQTVLFQANQIRELTNMKTAMERQIAQHGSAQEELTRMRSALAWIAEAHATDVERQSKAREALKG